ncbi:leucine--tRNA ligase [Aquimarina celericrescens]|uniref:Leucine--tRNA ligase n=1 Tax=Aquimarina celericrescens TaxID=1964542 RepID=A0ABW5B0E9_9FLAO|nr:leucine--tRNA ligase [Aquimarina celericrescens]
MSYDFRDIETRWQKYWAENGTFRAENDSAKPKYYVLDMFPYPSGAGLHVGHPLGYIASDIYARYKRHKGFNVLHPQGYDSFGLPAEQYAIQTGQHPAITTKENIARYREQLDKIGFSFDWSREVRTSDPTFYKWTQWIFIQLFNSWYDNHEDKARKIADLEAIFVSEGNTKVNAVCDEDVSEFTAADWSNFSSKEKQEILLKYRLTYLAETEVNWCPQLGTVLANDEIVNGVSERGGYPVVRKKMTQWSMRISAYAQRLLDGLDTIDWPQPLKDSQTNWIGRSEGAVVKFRVLPSHPQPFPEGRGSNAGYLTGNPKIAGELLRRAKEMRTNPTKSEAFLWERLKTKKLGFKFRQQHPIDNYIVDFVCLSKKLIIEVDGEIHKLQKEEDQERQVLLQEKKGYTFLRFSNDEILNDIDNVISSIENALKVLPSGEDLGGDEKQHTIEVFTTRPDTIFGVSFMTLAPEHELVQKVTTPEQKAEVEAYVEATAKRSERERMADVKTISGVFTGAYAEHPFTKEPVPIWIGDYVLAGYGTGAVMAVPCGDQRDYDFAKHYGIDIPNIFEGVDISEEAFADKENTIIANSDFLNGLSYKKATKRAIDELEQLGQGKGKINYRLRDAVFSRQRYWGEPFPVYYVDGMPQMIEEHYLPIELPEVEKYLPTETGEPPLGRADVWAWDTKNSEVVANDKIDHKTVFPLELNTMPGWAGSSYYFNRYMDPHNEEEIFSAAAINYWKEVDLYIGGSEHATGHLLYARFWQKFLFDCGIVPVDEFAKKLINQGMILGTSAFVHRVIIGKILQKAVGYKVELPQDVFVSKGILNDKKALGEAKKLFQEKLQLLSGHTNFKINDYNIQIQPIHVDVSFVNSSDELDVEAFKNWRPEFTNAKFVLENGKYIVHREVEKMSKSKYNVVNPDGICEDYGADSLRLYEMFLGPLEQAKPWNTAGITGVHSFLKKLWKLYHNGDTFEVSDAEPTKDNLKTLHKTIKKVEEDIENFSFNTSVSTFMIAVNELTAQQCNARAILEPLLVLISPYAPHIAEELWQKMGHQESISTAAFPVFEEKHLIESTKEYPISFNGKMRFTLELSLDLNKDEIEAAVMAHEKTQQQLEGRAPKKVIVVPGKIVNVVG